MATPRHPAPTRPPSSHPAPTHPAPPHAARAPHHPQHGPPPPPAPSGGSGESRATAAAWVAAVGAALLLAAAGTFLAVSWDALGLTARVAVVGGVTGAAILGGVRLRRVLPAVGAVVFHLGALLVPVDALGLAFQLEAGLATRWAAVGVTASLALPLLAIVGRSRVLGLVGLAGVPVAATAAGMAGIAPPSVVLAVLAACAMGAEVARRAPGGAAGTPADGRSLADERVARLSADPLAPAAWLAGPTLAFAAVAIPLATTLVARLVAADTVLGSAATGWVAASWVVPAAVGVLSVAVLTAIATRRHDAGIAALALAASVIAAIVTVLPPATPRVVLLLTPAVLWLLAEVAAIGGRDHRLWDRPTRGVATVLEVVAAAAMVRALHVLLAPVVSGVDTPVDVPLGMQTVTLAAAWVVAALRRLGPRGDRVDAAVVNLLAAALVAVAAASRDLQSATGVTGGILVAGIVGTLAVHLARWRTDGRVGSRTTPRAVGASGAAVLLSLALGALATVVLVDQSAVGLVVVALPLVVGAHLAALLRDGVEPAGSGHRPSVVLLTGVLVIGVPLLGWAAAAWEATSALVAGGGLLVATAGLLWLALCVDRLPAAADTLRALAVVVGLVLLVPLGGWSEAPVLPPGADARGLWWAVGLRVVPAALIPSAVVGLWLVVDAFRLHQRRSVMATLLTPVIVRFAAAAAMVLGIPLAWVGALLLVFAVAAGCAAALGPRGVRAPAITAGALAGPLGWVFVGPSPSLRAALLIAGGLALAGVGAARRRRLLGHLGGVVATVGVWQLFDLHGVTTLDLWALPVAFQLAVAGELARRRGSSSWIAFVPPLLLVAVPALAERIAGGAGWHAVLVGSLGVVAVVAGGVRRLGGPLVVGTTVVVAVVIIETFAVVAAVPTWVWLAIGGAVLLGAGALIERLGGSPVRAVRRAVDVVGERFD